MVIDSSALVAMLKNEPEAAAFTAAITRADRCRISAATLVETGIVVLRALGDDSLHDLNEIVRRGRIEIAPVGRDDVDAVVRAFSRFGRGRHPARLNFGDCFAYALAKETGEPLLFKGEDFTKTDVVSAL